MGGLCTGCITQKAGSSEDKKDKTNESLPRNPDAIKNEKMIF